METSASSKETDDLLSQIEQARADVTTKAPATEGQRLASEIAAMKDMYAFQKLMAFIESMPAKLRERYFEIEPGDDPELEKERKRIYGDIYHSQRVLKSIRAWLQNNSRSK